MLKLLVEFAAQANRELEFDKWMGANKFPQHFGKNDVTKSSDAPNRNRPRSSEPAK